MMEVPAKLDGLEMTNHLKDLFSDVAKREMMLHSIVTISGDCVVWKLRHHFEVFHHALGYISSFALMVSLIVSYLQSCVICPT